MLFEEDNYKEKIRSLKNARDEADAVIIGAGAGLSTAAEYYYTGKRFNEYFSDFKEKYGFDKKRLFYTQGDYGLFQCSVPCHQKTYDNKEIIRQMYEQQKDMKIPAQLIPKRLVCGKPMTTNLRSDDSFVQDEGWYVALNQYEDFIRRHEGLKVVYLELGVGYNTPVIIKYPFWRYTNENKNATYVCINKGEADAAVEIKNRSICIDGDINEVLNEVLKDIQNENRGDA